VNSILFRYMKLC